MIGENYLELVPGRSGRSLASGDTLPMARSNEYVEIDTILSTLQGSTRERARKFIGGLGEGLNGRGEQLNQMIDGTAGLVSASSPLLRTVARQREQTARLVDSFGSIARAVADRGDVVRQLAGNARTTFEAVASRDAALQGPLSRLPATLRQVRRTTLLLPQTSRAALAGPQPDWPPRWTIYGPRSRRSFPRRSAVVDCSPKSTAQQRR